MRRFYFIVGICFLLAVLLFIASFLYLDSIRRKTYFYSIAIAGREVGTIRVDKFMTEDKRVYKSAMSAPLLPDFTEVRERLDVNARYILESYTRQRTRGRYTEDVYLENTRGLVSFVSRYRSRFAFAENIPVRRDTFVFEESSPMTYLPIIENYNFARGRSQGFSTLTKFEDPSLPPMKRFATLTSIRDEYLKIDGRKVKAEFLVLKIKNYPQGALWVAKSDRSLLKIEIPKAGVSITRVYRPREVSAEKRPEDAGAYTSKKVSIKSGSLELSGTLTVSNDRAGKMPAVLLVCGDGPSDRELYGVYTAISSRLAGSGFVTLRYDRRGMGESGGSAAAMTDGDAVEDAAAALQFLVNQERVDPGRVAVVGYSKGASYAILLAAGNSDVQALVLMAPSLCAFRGAEAAELLKKKASAYAWSDEYLNLAIRTLKETDAKTASAMGNTIFILGKRCFVESLREDSAGSPLEKAKLVRSPVLIMQGKDEGGCDGSAAALDRAFKDAGLASTLRYYAYVGDFFGSKVHDGVHEIRYEVDKDVLNELTEWLKKNTAGAPAAG